MIKLLVLFVAIVGALLHVRTSWAQDFVQCEVPVIYTDSNGVEWATRQDASDWCAYLDIPPAITSVPVTNTPVPTNTPIPVVTNTVGVVRTPTRTLTIPATVTQFKTATPGSAVGVVPDQFSTINSAITALASGSKIRIKTGVYHEEVSVIKHGITLEAYGDGPVWIDGDCTRLTGITIMGDDVTVQGIGIRNTGYQGILVRRQDGVYGPSRSNIIGNKIQDWNCTDTYEYISYGVFTGTPVGDQSFAGIAVWYAGHGHTIQGNTITRRVDRVGSQRGYGNGIWFKSSDSLPSGGGHIISNNFITGGYDGIGGETEDHSRGSFDRYTVIRDNLVHDCADDGIQSEGGNLDIRIANNRIEECGIGIAMAPNWIGPLYIENNYITSSRVGVTQVLACFKIGNGVGGFAYITNNICHMPGVPNPEDGDLWGDGLKQTNSGLGGLVLRNNIFDVARYIIELNGLPIGGSSFEDNCLFTRDAESPPRFMKYGNGRYNSLAEFRAATQAYYGNPMEMLATLGPCTWVEPTRMPVQ